MAEEAVLEQAAKQLRDAAASGIGGEPIRDLVGTDDDVEIGYRIQQINVDRDVVNGRRVSGRKIGLTAPAVQAQMGVDQPDFGTLFIDMEYGDGVEIEAGRLMQPRAEAEVALVLEHDLDLGKHGFADIIRSTAFALPAIEIVDSRIADWNIRFVDTVADNASCGLYVLGGQKKSLADVDLRTIPMSMSINSKEVSTGEGSACLGHPLNAARWLADVMCERGTPLKAGDVVMTGALGPMKPMQAGDIIVADFGPLGSVTTHVAAS